MFYTLRGLKEVVQGCFTPFVNSLISLRTVLLYNGKDSLNHSIFGNKNSHLGQPFLSRWVFYERFKTLKLLDCLRSGPRVFYTLRRRLKEVVQGCFTPFANSLISLTTVLW